MAQNLVTNNTIFIISIALLLLSLATSIESRINIQFQNLKETNMIFYMHEIESGPANANYTAIPIAGIPNTQWSVVKFGSLFVIDEKLTSAYNPNSPQVGRAHGIYANAALDGSDLHLMMSMVFTNKEYNGSTLEIQGANRAFQKYREVSVVSGTGKFRLARGYATLETVFLDFPNLRAILRWNLTVFHY